MIKIIKNRYFLTASAVILFGITIALGSIYAKDRIALNDVLRENDAVNFACLDAKVYPDELISCEVNLQKEAGEYVYKINFASENAKYSYTVAADNGEIISGSFTPVNPVKPEKPALPEKDKGDKSAKTDTFVKKPEKNNQKTDIDKKITKNDDSASKHYISVDKAKSAALKHAGFKPSEVTFEKAVLEKDDGKIIYEIEFFTSVNEYEYEIDAYSGAVLSQDIDDEDDD